MSRWSSRGSARVLLATVALLLTAACSPGRGQPTGSAFLQSGSATGDGSGSGSVAGTTFAAMRGVRVVTVGDIACAPGQAVTRINCRDADTEKLAQQFRPRYVLLLGDLQYDYGEFEDFQKAYAHTWGKLAAISRPVPGNHDYLDAGAAGYLKYFKAQTGGRNYYAFDVGGWRIYALDSNCDQMDCAGEAVWLDKDMTANPRKCTAIAMHHPRYSSGTDTEHGDRPEVRPLWEVAFLHHADLALAGHEHQYQRFRAMDADGHLTDAGLVSFVVGTGGKSLYEEGPREKGEVLSYNHRAGVLDLKLGKAGFGWRFRNVDGKTIDKGVQACH